MVLMVRLSSWTALDKFAVERPHTKEKVEADLRTTQASTYASGTLRNLKCQCRSFPRFSAKCKVFEWPVSIHTLCLFVQYLAYTFHSAKVVRNYLNGVHIIHILMWVEPPSMGDIEVCITLMGLNKILLTPIRQAHTITPDIMLDVVTKDALEEICSQLG